MKFVTLLQLNLLSNFVQLSSSNVPCLENLKKAKSRVIKAFKNSQLGPVIKKTSWGSKDKRKGLKSFFEQKQILV